LSVGANLENVIHRCRNELSEEDRNDPNFAADSNLWPALLADEILAALEAFEGPIHPVLYNRVGRHAWWNGRSFWEVIAAFRAGLQVPAPRDFSASRASSTSTRAASSSSSRSTTLRRHSSVGVAGVSFRAPTMEVKQEAAPGSALGVKVEVKQEAPPEVKVEVKVEMPKVKVEVKDEPPSPPRGHPPTSRASKRVRTEATTPAPPPSPPSPSPPEPWRVMFTVPLMYRCPDDGMWAGYNAVVRLSAAKAGIIIINNNDEDDDGRCQCRR
jgi:hypothetical protein